MAYKLKYKDPSMPDDTLVDLGGVAVENGKTVTVTAEQELAVSQKHGVSFKDALKASPFLEITGTTELKGGDS